MMPQRHRRIKKLQRLELERFWSKVDRRGPDDCWLWLDMCNRQGNGRFFLEPIGDLLPHRIMYSLKHGDPGPNDVVRTCGHYWCVNPKHLRLRGIHHRTE